MRTIKFHIDDKRYFQIALKKSNPELTDETIDSILDSINPFKCAFTIFGKGNTPDRYELKDENGNKLNINGLNGYQKGHIIGGCYNYFEKMGEHTKMEKPHGVVMIEVI